MSALWNRQHLCSSFYTGEAAARSAALWHALGKEKPRHQEYPLMCLVTCTISKVNATRNKYVTI